MNLSEKKQHNELDGWHILGAVPTIIYLFDVDGRRNLFQNQSLGRYLGYDVSSKDDVLDEWRAYAHPEDLATYPAHFERLLRLEPGEVALWEYRLRRHDGAWLTFVNRDVLLPSALPARVVVGVAADITEQRAAEQQKDLLIGEMRHRSRNFGAILNAIAHQTRPKEPSKARDAFDHLVSRLRTLNGATEAVLESGTGSAAMTHVIRSALTSIVGETQEQVIVQAGPDVLLNEQAAGGVALIIHELATNALKHGALSVPEGAVGLSWTARREDARLAVALTWIESGGPMVRPPKREGFGNRVLKSAIRGSQLTTNYDPTGFSCCLRFHV